MPGGTGRSRPFLHCSSFKIVIRKTACKLPLTPFINIPLAHGDSTPLRNMHRQILHQPPPFKDTESDFLWSYDWLRFSLQWVFFQRISHILPDVSSVTSLCQGKCYFWRDLLLLFSLFVTMLHTNWHFCFFCRIVCKSLYQVCKWSRLSMVSKYLWLCVRATCFSLTN